jgi:hypothetical protein
MGRRTHSYKVSRIVIFLEKLRKCRELAYQLTEQFLAVGRPLGLTTITVVGGMDMMSQAKELDARPHIVVATPGRLCDLLRSEGGNLLSRVKVLVSLHSRSSLPQTHGSRCSMKQIECSRRHSRQSWVISSSRCLPIAKHACSRQRLVNRSCSLRINHLSRASKSHSYTAWSQSELTL